MAKSSGCGGWRTGGGDIASILTVRNTKSFSLNNVKDCSWLLLLHAFYKIVDCFCILSGSSNPTQNTTNMLFSETGRFQQQVSKHWSI